MNNIIDLIFVWGAEYLYLLVMVIGSIWFLIQPKPRKKEIFIFAGVCLLLILVIFKIASYLYYNPRPFVAEHFKSLVYFKTENSFPSHHTLLVSAIAGIVFIFNRRTGFVLWILALLVGFSRVYVGAHHIIDILGSILISMGSVALVYYMGGYLRKRKFKFLRGG